MKGKLLFLLLGALPLWGAPSTRESLALQELRITTEEIYDQARSQKVALTLLQERIETLEKEPKNTPRPSSNLESRLSQLEKAQKALLADLHALQKHENETLAEVKKLQTSLQSMLALLEQDNSSTYTVQSGDSLGLIAQKHKTDSRTLKKLNNLTSDTIHPGQTLHLPVMENSR
ncbi:MAG: D-gamma-glutamyl-meso-diaminopimelic acid endopeptidase CwlS [Chlamydiae bacterium]|nr:D-gamma-glutamyl-meso-diaminopimelic acid endopeptidase CwlS [Chlamydiota bacterium]